MCTHPDLATVFSLLVSNMHNLSPGHIEAVKYVGRYILSTMDLGLQFSSSPNQSLESYIHFPIGSNTETGSPEVTSFCDAN